MSFRAVSSDCREVKIFTGKRMFSTDAQMSFDSEYSGISSVEYFLGNLAGSILLAVLEYARHRKVAIEEIEGKLDASLANPLTLLHVKGCDQPPVLGNIRMTVYLYADLDNEELLRLCSEALSLSPIYNTLIKGTHIDVTFKPLT
ncbi:MAG: OsmC family protein [Treponema sp.]|jgi:uncharacterized OsmC-like protein|nr:OsmC family protein [Treponema sp.]